MVRHGQQHSAFGQTANREPAAEVRLGFRRRASRHVLGREERGRWFATGQTAQRVRSDSNSEPAAEQRCIWGFVGEHHSTVGKGGERGMIRHGQQHGAFDQTANRKPNSTARSIRQQTASQQQRCVWGFVGEHHSTVGKGGEREMVRHGATAQRVRPDSKPQASGTSAAEVRLRFRRRASSWSSQPQQAAAGRSSQPAAVSSQRPAAHLR